MREPPRFDAGRFAGTFAPVSRASLSPSAIACFGSGTFRPDPLRVDAWRRAFGDRFTVGLYWRSAEDAARYIADNAGRQFDPDVAKAFSLRYFRILRIGEAGAPFGTAA